MVNWITEAVIGQNLQKLLSYIFYPLCAIMGVPLQDVPQIAYLLGERAIVTELVAYQHLSGFIADGLIQDPRSTVIATYALCGFAHIASLAIFVGGYAAIAPERRKDLAKTAFRALFAATLGCLMTGAVAGVFYSGTAVLGG
jgi:CNT family concentrative nucleoside transporter